MYCCYSNLLRRTPFLFVSINLVPAGKMPFFSTARLPLPKPFVLTSCGGVQVLIGGDKPLCISHANASDSTAEQGTAGVSVRLTQLLDCHQTWKQLRVTCHTSTCRVCMIFSVFFTCFCLARSYERGHNLCICF